MARIYPSPISPATLSTAERNLYKLFQKNLPDEFTVFHSVAWIARDIHSGASDGEADFVIAHPEFGILILEVKGGAIQLEQTTGYWSSTDQAGVKHRIKDPFEQARKSTYALLNKLDGLASMRHFRWAVHYAIAFPDIVVNERLMLRPDTPRAIIIDKTNLPQIEKALINIYNYWGTQHKKRVLVGTSGINALTDFLAPKWNLQFTLARAFEDENSQIKTLTEQQFILLDFLSRHRRATIVGGAGTGKTMLAIEKARRLAKEGFEVLFVCFNRNLADWIEESVASEKRITATTFHSLAWKAVGWANLQNTSQDDEPADLLLQAIDEMDWRFDAIIVDEAQDFQEDWWLPLESLLREDESGILYVFFDDNQRIYVDRLSVPIEGEPFNLTINCRNTQTIHKTLAQYGDSTTRCDGPAGRTIDILPLTGKPEAALKTALLQLVNTEGIDPSHMIVLTPRAKDKSGWKEGQKLGTLNLTWNLKRKSKNTIHVSTIHSFKGLERPVVILTEMDHSWNDELVYVGLSRARNHVLVLGVLPQPRQTHDQPVQPPEAEPVPQITIAEPVHKEKPTMSTRKRPGGELAARPLHFIWIADCSGSMSGDKITTLNFAVKEAIPHMQKVADENPNAQVLVRAIRFSSGAQWHIAQPTPIADFKWVDLKTNGVTDMGRALSLVAEQLRIPPMTERALPPVLVLISDGQPTDNFNQGLSELMAQPWGKKAVRVAIAIGEDADSDVLQKFIGHPEITPLQANNPEALVRHIKFVSTVVLQSASSPASQMTDASGTMTNVVIPQPIADPIDGNEVW